MPTAASTTKFPHRISTVFAAVARIMQLSPAETEIFALLFVTMAALFVSVSAPLNDTKYKAPIATVKPVMVVVPVIRMFRVLGADEVRFTVAADATSILVVLSESDAATEISISVELGVSVTLDPATSDLN